MTYPEQDKYEADRQAREAAFQESRRHSVNETEALDRIRLVIEDLTSEIRSLRITIEVRG